jgi:serine/threonine protein kinase
VVIKLREYCQSLDVLVKEMSDSDNDWADSDDDVDSLYNIDVESNISRRSSALGGRTQSTGAVNPEAVLNVNEFGPSNIYYVDIESEPAINYEDSYFSYLGGRGPASCPPKESDQVQHSAGLREERSFLDLITAISIIYSEGDYEDMIGLDDVPLDHLDSGADFLVSTTRRSTQSSGRSLPEGIVVKRSRDSQSGSPLQSWEAALFVRELTILHNLRGHPAIPKLRGIGWFYDYLLDVELTPSPKPAILMEKASSTLEGFLRIFQSLPFVTEMRICSDVAKGLQALHSHRLVHGDVKPANVLVFTEDRIESWSGGSRINCKISDFSLSREVGTEDCWFNWGTPLYCAPENKRHLSPQELLLTDVWSLGVLFCRVTQRNLDLHSAGDTAESMATRIHHSVEDSIKDHSSLNAEYSSSWEEEMKAARRGMFQFTIQCDPRNRNLAIVLDILDDYLDAHSEPIEEKPIRITNFKQLYISYNVFEHIGGQVNDAIVLSLEEAIHGSDVRRRAQAYFELAIISISEYACPKFSVKDGLAFLKEAAALDDVRAQGLIYRLEQAILQSEPSSEAEHWLKRAAWLGHEIAMHDIQLIDPTFCTQNRNQSESSQIIGAESVNVMSSRLHLLAATGSTDELERLLQSDPFEIDYQDIEGNTPLILAAKFGNFGSVMRLLKAGAEMTLRNRASENFLHFAGRFSSTQISQILREYAPYLPELLLQSAHGVKQDSYLQIISNPPGTPLERAVAMDSSPAVQALLKGMRLITPPNGRVVRRALLLAIKLNLSSIVKLIMSFIQTHKSDWDPSIPELSRTRWNYQGEVKNFFDALLLGSKACDISPDVPLKWWRYCQLGAQHSNALQEIYVLLAELYKDKTESLLDSAIEDALQERHWDSISAALCWKAEITSGVRKRLTKSLRPLVWMQESVPISPKRRFYRYWFESFSSNLEDFQCYNSCRKEAFQKVDQNYGLNENRDSEPWEVMQSGEDDIRILERYAQLRLCRDGDAKRAESK